MRNPEERGIVIHAFADRLRAVDASCGSCLSCHAGQTYWCQHPVGSSGTEWTAAGPGLDPDWARAWLGLLAALVDSPPPTDGVLLVLAEQPHEAVRAVLTPLHAGPILIARETRDPALRSQLAELSASGRAPAVASASDGNAAVRAVQRGGSVYLPDVLTELPSVTNVVQRLVTVHGPHSADVLQHSELQTAWAANAAHICRPPHQIHRNTP